MIPYRRDRKRKPGIQGGRQMETYIKPTDKKTRRRRPAGHPSIFHTRIHIYST